MPQERLVEQSRSFLTAQWRNLVMLSYEIDPAALIDRVPPGTTLDFWHGKTFVSLVGFEVLDTQVLGTPVPFHQDFEEVNLRFYVRRTTDLDEVRPGVVFICEVVPRPAVGGMARLLYREPYMVLPMRRTVTAAAAPDVRYEWERNGRWHAIAARATGPGAPAAPGSLEEFITERHWGYNGKRGIDTLEYHVEHPRWQVWAACDVLVEADLVALCGAELARDLKHPPLALLADGSAVGIEWRTRLSP